MKNVVLFDLGGTLAHYYDMHEFPAILKQAIIEVQGYLSQNRLLHAREAACSSSRLRFCG